jgi:ribosomal protein L7/L12
MNKEKAQAIAERYMSPYLDDLALIHDATEEFNFGWAFYFQSKKYVETRNIYDMLIGNGPILVERKTGKIHDTGSAVSLKECAEAFEACGHVFAERLSTVRITGSRQGANRLEAIRLIRDLTNQGLASANQVVESVLKGGEASFDAGSPELAKQAVINLNELGFESAQNWQWRDG